MNCSFYGHENYEILGFCLYKESQQPSTFCLLCVTQDQEQIHQNHQNQYCKGFRKILEIIQSAILSFRLASESYHQLNIYLIRCEKQIEKTMQYKSKGLIKKLKKKRSKIDIINQELIEKKTQLEQIELYLKQQNFQMFRQHIILVRQISELEQSNSVFSKILSLLDIKYQQCLQIIQKKNIPKLIKELAENYFIKGQKLLSEGEQGKAIKQFDNAIKSSGIHTDSYFFKGKALFGQQEYEKAVKCYDIAIQLDKNQSKAYDEKGNALFSLQQLENAMECYNNAIDLDSKMMKFQKNINYSLVYCVQDKEIIQYYDEMILLNSKISNAYQNKGDALMEKEKCSQSRQDQNKYLNQAIECYEEAISQVSQMSEIFHRQGDALFCILQHEVAIKYYKKAIKFYLKEAHIQNKRGNASDS